MGDLKYFTLIAWLILSVMGCRSDLPFDHDANLASQASSSKESASPNNADLEELISGAMLTWWQGTHGDNPSNALIVAADALTASWGNFGMRDLSSEPRTAFNNSPTYRNRSVTEEPWNKMYEAISAVNEALRAIRTNSDTLGADTPRAKAFAKFVQGLSHGFLALMFDQAFILDETIDLQTTELELRPYDEVMEVAIVQLEECISISKINIFTLPDTWINGLSIDNTELIQLAHAYIARYLVQVARNTSERARVDWNKVLFHVDRGITSDFSPLGDGSVDKWFHSVQWFHNDGGQAWARLDYKLIGPSDRSNGYRNWLDTPVAQRTEFEMDTADLRLWDQTRDATGRQNPGLYAGNRGPSPFPASRGTYHFSMYSYHRYGGYRPGGGTGRMRAFLGIELDYLTAEAKLWLGQDLQEVVDIINSTRVINGGLGPATVSDGMGRISDERKALKPASLWAMLKYEKGIELLQTGPGIDFFDRRGWGELTPGTPIHFPVPGKELKFLLLPNYTFGGGGPGSAQ